MGNSMGNCKDCKHWDQSQIRINPDGLWGDCKLAEQNYVYDDEHKFYARFDGLRTQWDFGCNQFEAREERYG